MCVCMQAVFQVLGSLVASFSTYDFFMHLCFSICLLHINKLGELSENNFLSEHLVKETGQQKFCEFLTVCAVLITNYIYIGSMNLDEELDRILARADFTEVGQADDEPRLPLELVGAV